jgi:S-DNA-T family DNA segregation ATPase FtsK/SpoIIIE
MAEKIAHRARGLREAAGTLSGHALGEQIADTGPAFDLLADIWGTTEDGRGANRRWTLTRCDRSRWPAGRRLARPARRPTP